MKNFCQNCGSRLDPNTGRCPYCDPPGPAPTPRQDPPAPEPVPTGKKTQVLPVVLLIAGLLLIAVIAAVLLLSRPTPEVRGEGPGPDLSAEAGRIPEKPLPKPSPIPGSPSAAPASSPEGQNALIPVGAVSFAGHHYYFYPFCAPEEAGVSTWEQAMYHCQELGGHLASISSQEENDFLYRYILDHGHRTAYFGLTSLLEDGQWTWCSGEETVYTNWHYGEPNDDLTGEFYAAFYEFYDGGFWNDLGAPSEPLNLQYDPVYLCEWDS